MKSAILALHWQVNVIEPDGFFGALLAAPVAASGVVERARQFHADAIRAGARVLFTRFTVPVGEGDLVRNTGFMTAVAQAQEAFRPEAPGAAIITAMRDSAVDIVDNQRLSGLAGPAAAWIARNNIDTVFITGVATNLTVEQTARHATDLGLTAHVVSDCVAAADDIVHSASLANLELTTAGSVTADQALGQIGG